MNIWVRLPAPLDAGELLGACQNAGVNYLPARYFMVSRQEPGGLRLSFAGVEPQRIAQGLEILGRIVGSELSGAFARLEPAPAMV
jgi:DNA-binding transcriptional MocR family regulator